MEITYGKVTPTLYSDPEVVAVSDELYSLGHTVDTYPILQYVPGYLTKLQKWHQ